MELTQVILFTIGLAAVQICPILLHGEKQREYMALEEAFLVSMIMLLPALLVAVSIGTAIGLTSIYRRLAWYKTLFNVVEMAAFAGLGAWLSHLVGTNKTTAVAGALVFTIGSAIAVNTTIAITAKQPVIQGLGSNLGLRCALAASALTIGVAMASNLALFAPVAFAGVALQMYLQNPLPSLQPAYVTE